MESIKADNIWNQEGRTDLYSHCTPMGNDHPVSDFKKRYAKPMLPTAGNIHCQECKAQYSTVSCLWRETKQGIDVWKKEGKLLAKNM